MNQRRILVTSALPYANSPLHLGHILEVVQTDIWVRFQRARGHQCYYVCADDAHGTAIMLKAEAAGLSAEQHIAGIKELHEADLNDFLIGVDNFYSTHSEENRELSEQIYKKLDDNGHIISRTITQAFDDEKGLFLADRFIKGTCPKCRTPDQYGDNCESCGATYTPNDLIDPISALSGSRPVAKDSEHFFFDLPQFEQMLRDWLASDSLQPEISNKLREWLDSGLQPWDISRDAPYFGFEIPDRPGKFFYVWLDAPIGYMASFKNYVNSQGKPEEFDAFWSTESAHETELYHFIGKDIINFHGLFWPAMLHSSGFRKPTGVFAHGFVTVNDTKMSKSRGIFINARTWLEHLGPEPLRYYYAAKLGNSIDDINLNLDDFVARVNSDLVGKLINIASRCAGFVARQGDNRLSANIENQDLWNKSVDSASRIADLYENRETSKAIKEIMVLADAANEYIAAKEPWKLAKDPANQKQVVAICSQGLNLFRLLMIYLQPVLPSMSLRVATFLNDPLRWTDDLQPLVEHDINAFEPLMRRIEPATVEAMVNASEKTAAETPVSAAPPEAQTKKETQTKKANVTGSPVSEEINFADFDRVDLRVALITEAREVDGSDKLLQLTVDLGQGQTRNLFSGIKAHYTPEQLIGRHTVVVANLKPRKMRFGVSEAMVLCAGNDDRLFLLDVDSGAIPGMRIN